MNKLKNRQKLITFIVIIVIIAIIGIVISVNAIRINIANSSYNSANNNSSSGNLLPEYIKEGITLGGVTGTLIDLDTSDATAKPEDILKGKTAYVKGKKITGTKITRDMLKIGDYIDYTPDSAQNYTLSSAYTGTTSNSSSGISQEDLNWRILNINEDGTIDLISSIPTSQTLYLRGSSGYNNGVFLLNDICQKLYSNSSLGTKARSIKLEDIEKLLNETGNSKKFLTGATRVDLGETYTYTAYTSYPTLYAKENGSGINTSNVKTDGINYSNPYYTTPTTDRYTKANTLTITQKFYFLNMEQGIFNNNMYVEILGNKYWIATRYNNCGHGPDFGIRCMYKSNIYQLNGYDLFFSTSPDNDVYYEDGSIHYITRGTGLRPIVTLNSSIKILEGEGTESEPYKIG